MVGLGGRSYVKRCHDCRRRKIKCDGKQPACRRCIDSGIACKGYERTLEFVHFDGKSNQNEAENSRVSSIQQKSSRDTSGEWNRLGALRRKDASKKILINDQEIIGRWSKSLGVPQYKAGFLSVLQDRYLPEKGVVSGGHEQALCESWIAEACRLSYLNGSDRLSDTLLAMALSLVGQDKHDNELSTASVQHYSRALKGLRAGFGSGPVVALDQPEVDISLITCLCCSMYEMVANKSYSTQFQHLQGIGAMLNARGAENLQSAASRRTFYEYRAIQLPVCLTTRRVSYLCLPEWIDPPWKSLEPNSSSRMQTLIDPAFQLPVLMETFDKARVAIQLNKSDAESSQQILDGLKRDALGIEKAIEEWDTKIHGGAKKLTLYIKQFSESLQSLKAGPTVPYSMTYAFPNFEIAAALMYSEMIKIFLYQLIIDLATCARECSTGNSDVFPEIDTEEYSTKAVECADRICQSTDYFLEDHKRMVGRMVFLNPFAAAKSLLSGLRKTGTDDPEKDDLLKMKAEYCEAVNSRCKAEGLPVWDGMRLSAEM